MFLRRCAYCRLDFSQNFITKDHVIAGSWYPDSTSEKVQRITVPACTDCNNKYSLEESYVFLRLAACVNPQLEGATGIWKQAKRAFNADLAKTEGERLHRCTTWETFQSEIRRVEAYPTRGLLPSFSSNYELGSHSYLRVDANKLDSVIKKWCLGIHYYLWRHAAAIDAEIKVHHISDEGASFAFSEIGANFKTIDKGPGIIIRYATASEEHGRGSIYSFTIWQQFKTYGSIREVFRN